MINVKKLLFVAFLLFPCLVKADPTGPSGTSIRQVQDEGTGLTRREKVNFIGSAITCVDNSGSLRTDCTITAGAGASSLEVFSNYSGTRSSPTAAIEIGGGLKASVTGSTHTFRIDFSSVASKSDITSLRGYDLEPATVTPRFNRGAEFGTLAISTHTPSISSNPYIFISSVTSGGQFSLVVSSSNVLTPGTTVAIYMIPGNSPTIQIRAGIGDNAVVISSTNFQLNSRRQLRLGDSDNSNYTGFVAPPVLSTNLMWRLPLSDSSGCWKSDGAGNLSIASCGSGGASSLDDLSDVSITGASVNQTLIYNGSAWVNAAQGTSFAFSVASFSNGLSGTQEIGSGVWKSSGSISFTATYNNGPPTSSTITFSGWGTPLYLSSPYTSTTSVASVSYPAVAGTVVFTLNSTKSAETDTETITHTFVNRIYYGVSTVASGYTESNIEGLAGTDLQNSKSKTFSVSPGASEYIIYAYPTRLGTATFTVGGFEGGFQSPETVSITNASGYTENFYAYRSTNLNLGSTTVVAQ